MRNTWRWLATTTLLLTLGAGTASAQRATTVGDQSKADKRAATAVAPAPQSIKAKYEGGVLGFNKKQTGTLTFDDPSARLIFRDQNQKEYISISYAAIVAAFADTQSRRPTATRVIGGASIYTLPALLVKRKYRYLTLQYNDPDTKVQGTTSFKLDDKETLAAVLNALANKAGLTQRGEAFVRLDSDKPTP